MDIRDKIHRGDLYFCLDESLMNEQRQCLEKLYDFNATRPNELDKRFKN